MRSERSSSTFWFFLIFDIIPVWILAMGSARMISFVFVSSIYCFLIFDFCIACRSSLQLFVFQQALLFHECRIHLNFEIGININKYIFTLMDNLIFATYDLWYFYSIFNFSTFWLIIFNFLFYYYFMLLITLYP